MNRTKVKVLDKPYPVTQRKTGEKIVQVRALYPLAEKQADSQITFEKGDILEVIDSEGEQWWDGILRSRGGEEVDPNNAPRGLFPLNYFEVYAIEKKKKIRLRLPASSKILNIQKQIFADRMASFSKTSKPISTQEKTPASAPQLTSSDSPTSNESSSSSQIQASASTSGITNSNFKQMQEKLMQAQMKRGLTPDEVSASAPATPSPSATQPLQHLTKDRPRRVARVPSRTHIRESMLSASESNVSSYDLESEGEDDVLSVEDMEEEPIAPEEEEEEEEEEEDAELMEGSEGLELSEEGEEQLEEEEEEEEEVLLELSGEEESEEDHSVVLSSDSPVDSEPVMMEEGEEDEKASAVMNEDVDEPTEEHADTNLAPSSIPEVKDEQLEDTLLSEPPTQLESESDIQEDASDPVVDVKEEEQPTEPLHLPTDETDETNTEEDDQEQLDLLTQDIVEETEQEKEQEVDDVLPENPEEEEEEEKKDEEPTVSEPIEEDKAESPLLPSSMEDETPEDVEVEEPDKEPEITTHSEVETKPKSPVALPKPQTVQKQEAPRPTKQAPSTQSARRSVRTPQNRPSPRTPQSTKTPVGRVQAAHRQRTPASTGRVQSTRPAKRSGGQSLPPRLEALSRPYPKRESTSPVPTHKPTLSSRAQRIQRDSAQVFDSLYKDAKNRNTRATQRSPASPTFRPQITRKAARSTRGSVYNRLYEDAKRRQVLEAEREVLLAAREDKWEY